MNSQADVAIEAKLINTSMQGPEPTNLPLKQSLAASTPAHLLPTNSLIQANNRLIEVLLRMNGSKTESPARPPQQPASQIQLQFQLKLITLILSLLAQQVESLGRRLAERQTGAAQ